MRQEKKQRRGSTVIEDARGREKGVGTHALARFYSFFR